MRLHDCAIDGHNWYLTMSGREACSYCGVWGPVYVAPPLFPEGYVLTYQRGMT